MSATHDEPTTSPAREAGFTLIELLFVMALVALVAGVALPSLRPQAGVSELRAASMSIMATLRAARSHAIRTNAQAVVAVDTSRRTIAGPDGSLVALSPATRLAVLTLSREAHDASRGRIRFFPDGSATGGAIVLSHAARQVRIDVDWLTGHVRVVPEQVTHAAR